MVASLCPPSLIVQCEARAGYVRCCAIDVLAAGGGILARIETKSESMLRWEPSAGYTPLMDPDLRDCFLSHPLPDSRTQNPKTARQKFCKTVIQASPRGR